MKGKTVKYFLAGTLSAGVILAVGCSTRHDVAMAPVEIKPIHITIDVNVKVDRALDSFFDDIDAAEEKIME